MVAEMDDSIQELAQACSKRATVVPRWLPGSSTVFWYTREEGPKSFRFIWVDCEKGTREEAFDHEALAGEISKLQTDPVSADCLPIWWINIAPDASWVRFRLNEKLWQFSKSAQKLEEWSGEFTDWEFDAGCEEKPSPGDGSTGSITFKNHTSGSVRYLWINESGGADPYGILAAGESKTVRSYLGHIWRLQLSDSEKKVACVVKSDTPIVHVEEGYDRLGVRYEISEATNVKKSEPSSTKLEPFLRDFNLWVRDPATGSDAAEKQVSYGGVNDNQFKHIYQSPDGTHAMVWQCKQPSKRQLHIVESCPKDQLQPKLTSRDYLKPGDEVEIARPRLFDLCSRKEIPVDDALFQNPYALTNIGWSDDGKAYRFLFNERGHKIVRLLSVELGGQVRVLAEEKSSTFVDYAHKIYHKIMKNEFLWTSERDGWNHLYLFDLEMGTLKNQVTSGEWLVRSVESIDEEKRQIWFRGFGMIPGQDPYHSHLACVDFDGSNFRVITKADGEHVWKWGPERRYLLDTWSRVDSPPQTSVISVASGEEAAVLEKGDAGPLLAAGWVAPERFVAKGRDGQTNIYGVIFRPKDMDETKKYPVLENIYAGPQNFYTPKKFAGHPKSRQVAEQGYILVCLDGMGTNWRSKAFHDVCYKNLKDAGFPDRIAWIRAAAETRPWMDLDRVGCFGGSAGGQNAAAAVLHHGDFYKAASAAVGCHDNRLDKMWWNELWMGYPVDESYHESSNITHAHKLGGALLLVVGEMDTNVDPASTLRLADALIKAEKDFDMVLVPGAGHGAISTQYATKKKDAFFKKHLLEC